MRQDRDLAAAPSAHADGRGRRQGRASGDGVRRGRQLRHGRGAARLPATSGPSANTASTSTRRGFVWIGGNNCPTNGIAGLKPVADDQLLKLTPDGKLVLQIGKSNQSKGNADTRERAPRRRRLGPCADQRGVRRRRLRQPPRGRVRRHHRRVQADVGRVRRAPDGRRPLRGGDAEDGRRIRGRRTSASSTRCASRATASSTWPTARTGACSRSRSRAGSSSSSSRPTRRSRATWRCRPIATSGSSTSATATTSSIVDRRTLDARRLDQAGRPA